MTMRARVFVLIPIFNIAKYVADAINSVLSQTYQDWEILVLDDGSSDNSSDIVSEFVAKDSRITYHKNDSTIGMVQNWNKGISFCQSELFIKLDGDDFWAPDMLEEAVKILDNYSDVGLVFTAYVKVNSEGMVIENTEADL